MEKERWKEDFCRRHGIRPKFENMDFFVTNVEFTHDDASSSWRVRQVKHRRVFSTGVTKCSNTKAAICWFGNGI